MPALLEKEREHFEVSSIAFTSFIEPDGLYKIRDRKQSSSCVRDVVLAVNKGDGSFFYVTGSTKLSPSLTEKSYLEAYPIYDTGGTINEGLYEGELFVDPKVYSEIGCS